MFYQEALNYIENIAKTGSSYGLERMYLLLGLLDNPDEKLRFVHVAGTNGKGSVCAFLTSIAVAAGLKTGTYNSPSVFNYNEKYLIDGKPISDGDVAEYLTVVKQAIDLYSIDKSKRNRCDAEYAGFTAFEIETAVAFLCFKDKGCDICIIETGLGGRLDATNVIKNKELAVITPIGLDHCAILGNTLGEIASEKAAIIKDKAVTVFQSPEIMSALSCPYDLVNGEKKYRSVNIVLAKQPLAGRSDLRGQTFIYGNGIYKIKLLGEHQITNAALAIAAAEELKESYNISDDAIKLGLEKTVWKVRFEVINCYNNRLNIIIPQDKVLVLDGAHNPDGAETLAAALEKYFGGTAISLVIGVLADKDVDGILSAIASLATEIITVTPSSPRALDADLLKEKASRFCKKVSTASSVAEAVKMCFDTENEVTVVCGSLTLFAGLEG